MLTKSFWIGGFECSSHRRKDGRRLDLLAATGHDRFAAADYRRLRREGIGAARDGVRWHLVERSPGRYDFSSLLPMVRAARDAGRGGDLGPLPLRLAGRTSTSFARASSTGSPPMPGPSPASSRRRRTGRCSSPGQRDLVLVLGRRGRRLSRPVCHRTRFRAQGAARPCLPRRRRRRVERRAAGTHPALRPRDPRRPGSGAPRGAGGGRGYHEAQFQAWDMITGRLWPQLGGDGRYLGALGVNYYPYNQWIYEGPSLQPGHPLHRPFREILRGPSRALWTAAGHRRDRRPGRRPRGWLATVGRRGARRACERACPSTASASTPSWTTRDGTDDRHCRCGLWGYPEPDAETGRRALARSPAHRALAARAGPAERSFLVRLLAGRGEQQQCIVLRTVAEQDVRTRQGAAPDLVCLSHLRWDFVYQRPQHLMSRFARDRRVFFVEEPHLGRSRRPRGDLASTSPSARTASGSPCPTCPPASPPRRWRPPSASCSAGCSTSRASRDYVLWYYTPMALGFSAGLTARGGGLRLHGRAVALPRRAARAAGARSRACSAPADLVFTGGQSLYEAKRDAPRRRPRLPQQHRRRSTSAGARPPRPSPPTRPASRGPRLGYFGVIDERIDLDLLAGVADAAPGLAVRDGRPGGEDRSRRSCRGAPTSTSSGMKAYDELPAYLAGWDVGADAVRAERVDALHQPDQDARVPGRRAARGLHADPRRGAPLRRARAWCEIADGAGGLRRPRSSGPGRCAETTPAARRGCARSTSSSRASSWDRTWRAHGAPDRRRRACEPRRPGGSRRLTGDSSSSATRGRSEHLERRSKGAGSMFDYLIVGAGFAGSVLAERLARGSGKTRADRRPAPPHRRQCLRPLRRRRHPDPQVRPAHLPHQLRARSSSTSRSSPTGAPTSTACWPASTASSCRSRSTWTPSTSSTA